MSSGSGAAVVGRRNSVSEVFAPFEPPARTLMGPGPSDVHPRVLGAMARPTIGHLDPEFVRMMDELKELLRYAFRTDNAVTFPVSGPGSVGMEMCFVNLLEPGEEAIVCCNGVFGRRMVENVSRCGASPVIVEDEWGTPVSLEKVASALEAHPDASVVAFVQAETSTGVHTDPEPIVRLAHEHGCLAVVDTVTALAGCPVCVDEWNIDAVYAGSQKCLSCPPGLAPVSFGERALDKIHRRSSVCQSWFMDMDLQLGYWSSATSRTYHHTAPVNALYGLHEALLLLREEGLENAWARHRRNHRALVAGFEAMGILFLVAEPSRLPQLNAIFVPEGIDEAAVRNTLLSEFSLEVGAGLGDFAGRVWRVGLMGHASSESNVMKCLGAFEEVLSENGHLTRSGDAERAARAVIQAADLEPR